MPNTTNVKGRFINIILDANTDWDFSVEVPKHYPMLSNGIKVLSIEVRPTATDDTVTIRDAATADTSSPILMETLAASKYDIPRKLFRGGEGIICRPSIKDSETTGACQVTIECGA